MVKMTLQTLTRSDVVSNKGIIYTKDSFDQMKESIKENLKAGGIKLTVYADMNGNIVDRIQSKMEHILATVTDIRDGEIDIEVEEYRFNVLKELIDKGFIPSMIYIGNSKDMEDGTILMYNMRLISFTLVFNNRIRGFEKIKSRENEELIMPQAQTKNSAGYDFFIQEDIEIKSNLLEFVCAALQVIHGHIVHNEYYNKRILKPTIIKTGIKAYMMKDEHLDIYLRSSVPKNYGLIMANSVGIVDSDYYSNEENDGEIGFMVYNLFPCTVKLKRGERIGQGIFQKFLKTDEDNRLNNERLGGTGSTSSEKINKEECIVEYMTFKEAFKKMKEGYKVKLPSWEGYWSWEDNTIKMYCREDNIDPGYTNPMDIRQTQRVEYTINNIITDKWIIADETNCPLLGGIAIMDEEDAIKYKERELKLKNIAKNQWIFDE